MKAFLLFVCAVAVTWVTAKPIVEKNLAAELLNARDCTRITGDRYKIIKGNILLQPSNGLVGQISVIDNTTVRVADDTNEVRVLKVLESKRSDKRLIFIMLDVNNVFLACPAD
jgi:hypothetical protein